MQWKKFIVGRKYDEAGRDFTENFPIVNNMKILKKLI